MRRRSRGAAVAAVLAVLVAGWSVVALRTPAGAHTPHDVQADIAVSPTFATDQRVWTITQGMVLRSDDAGATWIQLQAGAPPSASLIEVAPGDPSVLYLVATYGRVFRSGDGGDTWRPTATVPALAASGLAVSPVDTSTLLLATVEHGNHLSTDGGDTWHALPADVAGPTVAFGAEAALLLGSDDGRVHRSDDNGRTWTTAEVAPGTPITALAGGGDEVVYAGTDDGRVLRSDDDGRTFGPPPPDADAADQLPEEPVSSLARSPGHATDGTVWALTETSGAHRSTDRGTTWTATGDGLTTAAQADELAAANFRAIVAAADGDGDAAGTSTTLFLAGFDGLFRSTDRGDTWLASETLGERIVAVAVSPEFAADHTIAVATYVKGAFISTDAGDTWQPMRDGLEHELSAGNELVPLRRMHGMSFSPDYQTDRTVYSATWVGFLRHRRGRWTEALIGQDGDEALLQQFVMAVHPDGTIDLGSQWGEIHRSTQRGDAGSWEVIGQVGGEVRSLLVDPVRGHLWAATTTDVYISRDEGATFEQTDLGGPAMAAGWFGPDRAVVFAGTPNGLAVTSDGGSTWEPLEVLGDEVAGEELARTERVEAIAVSPDFDEDGLVLVSLGSLGLFRSTDGGASFRPVATELLADQQLIGDLLSNATSMPIQFSPRFAEDGTVFAHTDRSVLRSTDRGTTWDVLTLPSVFQVLADTAPGQLDLIVTPDPLPGPTPVEDHSTEALAAWAVIGTAVVGMVLAVSRRRRPG